ARFWREADGSWVQEVAAEVEPVELRERPAEELEAAIEEAQRERELERGPMLRCCFLRTAEGEANQLLLDVHHLVVDGVSWRVLSDELLALCGGRRLGAKGRSFREWGM